MSTKKTTPDTHMENSMKGGKTTLKKYGKKHFSKISSDAWAKRKELLAKASKKK